VIALSWSRQGKEYGLAQAAASLARWTEPERLLRTHAFPSAHGTVIATPVRAPQQEVPLTVVFAGPYLTVTPLL